MLRKGVETCVLPLFPVISLEVFLLALMDLVCNFVDTDSLCFSAETTRTGRKRKPICWPGNFYQLCVKSAFEIKTLHIYMGQKIRSPLQAYKPQIKTLLLHLGILQYWGTSVFTQYSIILNFAGSVTL